MRGVAEGLQAKAQQRRGARSPGIRGRRRGQSGRDGESERSLLVSVEHEPRCTVA